MSCVRWPDTMQAANDQLTRWAFGAGASILLGGMALMAITASANVIREDESGQMGRPRAGDVNLARSITGMRPFLPLDLCPWPELRDNLDDVSVVGPAVQPRSTAVDPQAYFAMQRGVLILRDVPPAGVQLPGTPFFYYAGQLQQPSDWADGDVVCGAGTFMVVSDGWHPKTLCAFDGSNYQGLKLTFLQRSLSPPAALPLYDLETGVARIASVISVASQTEPPDGLPHQPVAQAVLAGGLLFSCLLGNRRRSTKRQVSDIVAADALDYVRPTIPAKPSSPAPSHTVDSCIYNYGRIVKVVIWAAVRDTGSLERGPMDAQLAASVAPRCLSSYRLRGTSALLSHASHLSLLLMRTSGRGS